MAKPDVIVVGAGMAGLCCALHLQQSGRTVQVLEASDGVGGRVRTDEVDGFLLDRGFQVLLTAYPEATSVLDYTALDLHAFEPGAMVRCNGQFWRLTDPIRRPADLLSGLMAPVGTWRDKLASLILRTDVVVPDVADMAQRSDMSTLEALANYRLSPLLIDRFFRPFLGGVFLERELSTSRRAFDFIYRMFALGDTALPSSGMGALPQQIADRLEPGTVQLRRPVAAARKASVSLEDGTKMMAGAVVVATDGPTAARLIPNFPAPAGKSVRCIYFSAPRPPLEGRWLVLNGDLRGPVNHMAVLSEVCPAYAPPDRALISVSVLEPWPTDIEAAVRQQLRGWFPDDVEDWQYLKSYTIEHALPAQPTLDPLERPVRLDNGIFVCGDHRELASLHGAMHSGRRAANAVLQYAVRPEEAATADLA